MADKDKFSIISVNADDDEEIVLQAGIVSDADEEEEVYEVGDDQPEPDDNLVEDEPVSSVQSEEGYQETTLEDLKSAGPMSKTQKLVLIAAFLLIVVAVVYYNFFMR